MRYQLTYHPLVEADAAEIADYYGEISQVLIEEIELEVKIAIAYLADNPLHQQLIYKQVRKMNLHKFPYAVYYIFHEDRIYIIAIMHLRRHPNVWQSR